MGSLSSWSRERREADEWVVVPDGVLSILPGIGVEIGTELVSSPIVKKVDITVRPTPCPRTSPVR